MQRNCIHAIAGSFSLLFMLYANTAFVGTDVRKGNMLNPNDSESDYADAKYLRYEPSLNSIVDSDAFNGMVMFGVLSAVLYLIIIPGILFLKLSRGHPSPYPNPNPAKLNTSSEVPNARRTLRTVRSM